MTTPRRLLREVTDPGVGDQPARLAEDPTAAERLLAAPAAAGQVPGTGVDRGTSPGAPFLAMVERAEKVAPIHADTARLAPDALLQMIGGVADPTAGASRRDDRDGQRAAEAALERLAAAAWDVIRTGAADDEPGLLTCLVEISTRLGGIDPRKRQRD